MLASTLLAIFAKNVVPVLASFFSCYSCLLFLFYPNSFSLAFLPVKKWFGVGASKLSALSLLAVFGWLFTIFSTSVKTVIIWKYVSILSLTMLNRDAFTKRINLSQELPICGELGGLNSHAICCFLVNSLIFIWLRLLCSSLSSLTAPLKFDPQSDTVMFGLPLLLMNLQSALMKESVSIYSKTVLSLLL